VKSDGKEAARGAELLLSAIALHRICFNGEDDDSDDGGSSVDDLLVSAIKTAFVL
jgi:hypothetical protein